LFLLAEEARETPKEEHFFFCLAWEMADATMDSHSCFPSIILFLSSQGIMEAFPHHHLLVLACKYNLSFCQKKYNLSFGQDINI
jgi:hypothetical protein